MSARENRLASGKAPLRPSALSKADRSAHPASAKATPPPPTAPSYRTGPGMVRTSLYVDADVMARLHELASALHHDSRGTVSKATALSALIQVGTDNFLQAWEASGVDYTGRV